MAAGGGAAAARSTHLTTQTTFRMIHCRGFGVLFALACLAWGGRAAPAAEHPARLGINIAGDWHTFHTNKLFYQYDAWFAAVKDLGPQFIDVNFMIRHALFPTTMNEAQVMAQLQAIDAALRAHGLQYTLSVELANWSPKLELTPGVNMFDHADGTHRWDLPHEWLDPILPPLKTGTPALLGINFDEGEHNQLWGNGGVFTTPTLTFDKPYYLVTDGMAMKAAFDGLVARAQWLRTTQYQGRLAMLSEQHWPDMFHIFARAGWTVAPKFLQETIAPVGLSAALGAALQYQAAGSDLWVNHDINRGYHFPGWPPSALRSALLMSYWTGASALYVENLDFADSTLPPCAGSSPRGALLAWSDPDHYTLTNHGKVVQDFFRNYVPAHPRPITWRDYQPRVAIIRLPDGCTGRPNLAIRDRLLGNRAFPSDAISAEWLKIWPILTHGVVRPAACTMAHVNIYPDFESYGFFVPIDSVAVFDHTVHGAVLDPVQCFIVCGYELSAETFNELKSRAAASRVSVIIARRLYNKYAGGPLAGDWLIVDDFADPAIAAKIAPYLGGADVARYRFKDYTVEFRPTTPDLNTLEVSVLPRKNAADPGVMRME